MTVTCQTCRNWEPNEAGTRGLCRYAPPRSQIVLIGSDEMELKAVWPTTAQEDRCGAWADERAANRRAPRTFGVPVHPTTAASRFRRSTHVEG